MVEKVWCAIISSEVILKERKNFMDIGNVHIKNKIVVAPMAGVTNTSYRKILRQMGAGLIYAEMVSDKALCYKSKKTLDLLKMDNKERPISQQIFGSDEESFIEAAKLVENLQHPDIIDINTIWCKC